MKSRLTLYIRDMQRQRNDEPAAKPSLRPKTRGDCVERRRPCPFVGCRHHLFMEVTPAGSIKMPFGPSEDALFEMAETCSLDVADRGDHDMNRIGQYLGVTAARVQQEVADALKKLRTYAEEERIRFQDLVGATEDGHESALEMAMHDYQAPVAEPESGDNV